VEQVPNALRGLAAGPLEGGQLVDLVDDPQPIGGIDQQTGGVLDRATGPDQ
jgi:hypothetical protein